MQMRLSLKIEMKVCFKNWEEMCLKRENDYPWELRGNVFETQKHSSLRIEKRFAWNAKTLIFNTSYASWIIIEDKMRLKK